MYYYRLISRHQIVRSSRQNARFTSQVTCKPKKKYTRLQLDSGVNVGTGRHEQALYGYPRKKKKRGVKGVLPIIWQNVIQDTILEKEIEIVTIYTQNRV